MIEPDYKSMYECQAHISRLGHEELCILRKKLEILEEKCNRQDEIIKELKSK